VTRAGLRKEIAAHDQQLTQLARAMDQADTDREDVQSLSKLTAA
jgi:hypothetical protein